MKTQGPPYEDCSFYKFLHGQQTWHILSCQTKALPKYMYQKIIARWQSKRSEQSFYNLDLSHLSTVNECNTSFGHADNLGMEHFNVFCNENGIYQTKRRMKSRTNRANKRIMIQMKLTAKCLERLKSLPNDNVAKVKSSGADPGLTTYSGV